MAEAVTVQKKTSLFTNTNYLYIWLGQSLSMVGDYFFVATIVTWMIDKLAPRDWVPLATGAAAMAATLPALLIGPLAGVFIDRWNRRRTMLWVDGLRFAVVALFLLLVVLTPPNFVLIAGSILALLLIEVGTQFFVPSREVVIADIVPADQHVHAYGSLRQARYFAQIVGPSIAVPLYVTLGPVWAISLNLVSFLLSLVFVLLVRLPTTEKQTSEKVQKDFWSELRAGWRFFIGNRVLVTLLISGMIFMLGGMAYNSFEYLYGKENLHVPETLLGVYVACHGTGVVLGLPLSAFLAKRYSEVAILWLFLICTGLSTLGLALVDSMIPGMIFVILNGIFSSSIFVAVRPLTILVTPRELVGRVMSVEVPMIQVASLLGGSLASILASTVLVNLHVQFAGITFTRLNTIFVIVALLTIGAGLFARLTLYPAVKAHRARLAAEQAASEA
jgi:MFS family permease